MVERIADPSAEDHLSEVLKAAGDPTRRAILTLLAQNGPTRVTEIAERFAQSLNAISRHIMVLERARLVRRRTVWRTHMIEIDLAPLAEVDRWFGGLRSIWALRLDALATALEKEQSDDPDHDDRTDDERQPQLSRPADPGL
jgi:DNA-binding transcriptional ArsR family regulator